MPETQHFPQRKSPRLKGYDYSQNGAYFVTVCTKNRKCLFGDNFSVGADSISARMVDRIFIQTIDKYSNIECPVYVIMPNHFHAIITINRTYMESAPTISKIVQSFKRHTTIEYIKMVKNGALPLFNGKIWQRSYHDHIIHNQDDYNNIFEYIQNNPLQWESDCHHPNNPKYTDWSDE